MPFETFLGRLKVNVSPGRSQKLACPGDNSYIYA